MWTIRSQTEPALAPRSLRRATAILIAAALGVAPAVALDTARRSGTGSAASTGSGGATAAGGSSSVAAAARTAPATFGTFKSRDDLKAPFNADRGKVRIVAFLSPACGHCAHNAAQLQKQILDRVESRDVSVHIVWLKLMGDDSPKIVPKAMSLLPDPRVHHYWDPDRRLNAMLLDAIGFDVQVRMYDIFLLYDRDAVWDKRLPKPGFWMHEFDGAPGPDWNAEGFLAQVKKALAGEPLDTPQPQ